jgi:histidinol-phosphate aminotransferase
MHGLRFNPQLLKVPLYVAGKSPEEVREELGLEEVLKLASNENPLGASPLAIAALQSALAETHRYPGVAERELRRRLARYHGGGLSPENFIIGNGGSDVLRIIAQSFIFDGGETVTGRVSFPLYTLLTVMFGGRPVVVEPRADYGFDLAAMAHAVNADTRIVWLCSPNNPTGAVLRQSDVDAFIAGLPQHVVVVLDESYTDYVDDPQALDGLRCLGSGRPVVVVRSFSKCGGLANLRVGYGVSSPEIIEYLHHVVLPFNTGAPVMRAAAASLDDEEHHRRGRELVRQERDFLCERVIALGLTCLPSQANFVLLVDPPGGAAALADAVLRRYGIITRPAGGFGMPNALRVTVGLHEHNERFVHALERALAAQRVTA